MKETIMTPIHLTTSTGRSPLRSGLLFTPLALFLALAGVAGVAQAAQIPPPDCPGPDCQKVITFYNNSTDHAVFPVIQAGIQSPDEWLQALFKDNSKPYAETHYSRVYVNPTNGIPPEGHVSVTVPWYSRLENDDDQYADWYNGCRIVLFDTKQALDMATNDPDTPSQPLQFASGSPPISCKDCAAGDPLKFYKSKFAYKSKYPFQLVEYTFATVETPPRLPPTISTLNVGYNTSYLDQIYLPVALAPCLEEPCKSDGTDQTAIGYLGTIENLGNFRVKLGTFSTDEGWPRYNGPLDHVNRPRLPGAYNVLVDRINVTLKHEESHFTPIGASVTDLIAQWKTCTSGDSVNCPDYQLYKQIDRYFRDNYENYIGASERNCRPSPDYPIPAPSPRPLDPLYIMAQVYGWAPFNSGCVPKGSFNDLEKSPGPEATFKTLRSDTTRLQYNYLEITAERRPQKQRFNPFVDLVHGQLKANSYAFSIDDAAGYQQHPGEGLIVAIGGANGLPNKQPVVPPANFKKDFVVNLSDSMPDNRPRWKSYSVCGDPPLDFPPLPKGATEDTRKFIVRGDEHIISPTNPCTITVTDASNVTDPSKGKYHFTVLKPVPTWPKRDPGSPPPNDQVVKCDGWGGSNFNWCRQMTYGAYLSPDLNFYLTTIPPNRRP
jgi:hypothetical protein